MANHARPKSGNGSAKTDRPGETRGTAFALAEGNAVRPVLVVEDDEGTREMLRYLVESAGYPVATASNGREALEQLRNGLIPSLILLDLMMPVMDGWQFRAAQLRDGDLLKIPTVVYSAVGNIRETVEKLNVAGGFEKGDFTEMLRFVAQFCPSVM